MKYSFILDNPKSETDTYIFLLATASDGRLKLAIRERINPIYWSKENQRPKIVKDKKLSDSLKSITKKIDRIADKLDELSNQYKRSGKPLLKMNVEREISVLIGKAIQIDTNDFFACFEAIYKDMVDGKLLTRSGKIYSPGTLKNYGQSLDYFTDFAKRHSLNFSDVSQETYREFVKHINDQGKSLNYLGQHIKNWKRIMEIAFERGWHSNTIYKHKEFKTPSEQTYDIYLTEQELKKMYDQNLSYNPKMEICRDWFIIDCYTGLRISDLKLLGSKNMQGEFITIVNEKTDTKVVLPVHPYVRALISKYNGFPPKMNDQEINDEIKDVAEICGIDKTELYTVTEGGKRKDYYLKRYQMVSNHTARRSFITNLIKAGVEHTMIMKLAGIVKFETLSRYIKLSAEEVADQAAQLDFFKG
jgi:site-specific recombinase XerD